jgi:hypothetical protein
MVRLAVDSVTNFSAAPLRLATWLGAISFFFCLIMLIYVVVAFALRQTVQGWASVLACVLFLGGVQLLCLGLLGEYLGRLYASAQGRPAFFVGYDSADGRTSADPVVETRAADVVETRAADVSESERTDGIAAGAPPHNLAANHRKTDRRTTAENGSTVGTTAKRNRAT